MSKLPACISIKIREKFENVLKNNPDFGILFKINDIINRGSIEKNEVPTELLPFYKYCPVTSVEVERSFSAFKYLLSDRRHSLTPENLEKYLIMYYCKNYSTDK